MVVDDVVQRTVHIGLIGFYIFLYICAQDDGRLAQQALEFLQSCLRSLEQLGIGILVLYDKELVTLYLCTLCHELIHSRACRQFLRMLAQVVLQRHIHLILIHLHADMEGVNIGCLLHTLGIRDAVGVAIHYHDKTM